MAKKNVTKSSKLESRTSRRNFIGALGAAAAASALPAAALAPRARPAASWPEALATWRAEYQARLPALRAAYLREIEALAEANRAGFESGELRATTDDDLETRHDERTPEDKVMVLVDEHFRVDDLDASELAVLLDCSPHVPALTRLGNNDRYVFVCAGTWDVIAHARARRWYTPTADECADPLDSLPRIEQREREEVRS